MILDDEVQDAYSRGLNDGIAIVGQIKHEDDCDIALVRALATYEIDRWRARHRSIRMALFVSAAMNASLLASMVWR